MSALTVNVDVLAGTNITDACRELCELADRLDVSVEMNFNDVTVVAKPGADSRELTEKWRTELESDNGYKIAVGHPVWPPPT